MAFTPLRTCLLAALLGLALGSARVAWAQEEGDSEDGGISSTPDASVGEGEDGVGRVVENCRSTSDCSPRFTCQQGKCRYTGVREAKRVGCMLGPEGALVLAGLGLAATWRRR
jgi:MYXO-CTERM domain-containing protein